MSTRVTCPDPSALVSYLYGEFEPGETPTRDEVSRHLEQCGRCATEVVALGGVREQLAAWTTPEADLGFQIVQSPAAQTRGRLAWMPQLSGSGLSRSGGGSTGARWSGVWSGVPMAAAAVLVLGAALGLARLDVQYDAAGLRVRTGWGHGGATSETRSSAAADTTGSVTARPASASSSTSSPAPLTTADIDALAERLRRELASSVAATSVAGDPTPAPQTVSLTPASEAALLKRLRQLVDESEMRQQQNLQLRVSELAREFQGRRQADLVQIEQGFGRLTSDNEAQRQIIREYFRNASTGARPPQ